MNLKWLEYFIIISETNNFHKAAEIIGITPPALNKIVNKIEKEFNIEVLKRGARLQGLTPAGKSLIEKSKEILGIFDSIEQSFNELRTGDPEGNITIAGEGTAINYLLPNILAKLLKDHPKIYPKLYVMLSNDIEDNVLNGEIDIGILSRKPNKSNLCFAKCVDIPHYIVGKKELKAKDWHDLNFIIPRFFKDRSLKKNNIKSVDGWKEDEFPRKVIAETETIESTISLCKAGVGVAFVPEISVRKHLEERALEILSTAPFIYSDEIYVIWLEEHNSYESFKKIVKNIISKIKDLY